MVSGARVKSDRLIGNKPIVLWAVTSYFNPMGYHARRLANYRML